MGERYGRTSGVPRGSIHLGRGAVVLDGAHPIWSADVDGATDHRYEMWRSDDQALVLAIGGRPLLRVSADRTGVTVGDVGEAVARQLVSTFAIPLAAQRTGAFVLHAAVAVRGPSAVAVCAESGSGKSSLLIALTDAGWAPLSEDLVAVDVEAGPTMWPGPPWVRVAPDASGPRGAARVFTASDKVAWALPNQASEPAVLTRIVLLDPPGEATTSRAARAEEVIAALGRHTPWFEEPERRGEHLFAPAVRLARAVPAVRVRLRRSSDWRAEAVALIDALA